MLGATGYKGASSFTGIVTHASNENGVYLALSGPFRLGTGPVMIPTSAVSACSRTQWSRQRWDTNLWLADARVDLSLPDNDGALLAWCKARGKEMLPREAVIQRMYPNGSWGTR